MLRTPLDSSSGTFRARHDAYDPELVNAVSPGPRGSARERLAVYQRQYWFRLFTVLQGAYPLTSRLLGLFRFNEHAVRFLTEHPPQGWDLDQVADGFDAFLARELAGSETVAPLPPAAPLATEALLEASRIDAAFHRVFRAPEARPYQPSAADAAHLLDGRLLLSPAAALLVEHWPLCATRAGALEKSGESALELPPRLDEPLHFVLRRRDLALWLSPLEAREAELLDLLTRYPVGEALALLEEGCATDEERSALPARARRWLARSVELGLWVGLSQAPE